jgi:hypothetical protein
MTDLVLHCGKLSRQPQLTERFVCEHVNEITNKDTNVEEPAKNANLIYNLRDFPLVDTALARNHQIAQLYQLTCVKITVRFQIAFRDLRLSCLNNVHPISSAPPRLNNVPI